MRQLHKSGGGGGTSTSSSSYSSYRSGGAHNPREFLNAMDRCPPLDLFTDRDQHDSQEFLRMLLDNLNDELNTVTRQPAYREEKDDFTEPEWDKAERLWGQYKARTNSVMVDVFAGQLRSSVECHACGKESTSYDPFWDLSLPLRAARSAAAGGGGGGGRGSGSTSGRFGSSLLRYMSGGGSSSSLSSSSGGTGSGGGGKKLGVLDCLRAFTEDETLEGSNTFNCPRCKAKGSATKRLRVRRWPRVLVLHLKRFQWGATGRPGRKIDTSVDVPAEISLGPFLTEDAAAAGGFKEKASSSSSSSSSSSGDGGRDDDDNINNKWGPKYKLFAVTNHMGSLHGGHYTATCDAGGGKWYTFNDGSVDTTGSGGAGGPPQSSSHAYVLLYALQ